MKVKTPTFFLLLAVVIVYASNRCDVIEEENVPPHQGQINECFWLSFTSGQFEGVVITVYKNVYKRGRRPDGTIVYEEYRSEQNITFPGFPDDTYLIAITDYFENHRLERISAVITPLNSLTSNVLEGEVRLQGAYWHDKVFGRYSGTGSFEGITNGTFWIF